MLEGVGVGVCYRVGEECWGDSAGEGGGVGISDGVGEECCGGSGSGFGSGSML